MCPNPERTPLNELPWSYIVSIHCVRLLPYESGDFFHVHEAAAAMYLTLGFTDLCQLQAELSVNILGSSIAMLTGQKPPFRLLVRAINSNTGLRVGDVHHAVSNAFVVATQRVKGAQKAEIPHVEEHVSKIENVGVQTQHKLQDIRAAAQAAGITGLNIVHNTVNTGAVPKPSCTKYMSFEVYNCNRSSLGNLMCHQAFICSPAILHHDHLPRRMQGSLTPDCKLCSCAYF